MLTLAACGHRHADGDHEHSHHEQAEAAEEHHHAEGEIVVEPEVAARFGVTTATVQAGALTTGIKAAGTFVSSASSQTTLTAPVSGTVSYSAGITVGSSVRRGQHVATVTAGNTEGGNVNAAARAAMEAAKRELDRLEPLYRQQLVTATEYNAARAAYEQARAAYSPAAGGSVVSGISGVVTTIETAPGQYAAVGTPLMTISSGDRLTLRVDVPHTQAAAARQATDANIVLAATGQTVSVSELGGHRISTGVPGAGAPSGFVAVYFDIPNTGGLLTPGTTAEVYLLGAGGGQGISVPRTALCEIQGSYFVYEKTGDHAYRRLPVTIAGGDGINTVITTGLQGGETIVTNGVTTIRLAENSGAIPEGHSHHH